MDNTLMAISNESDETRQLLDMTFRDRKREGQIMFQRKTTFERRRDRDAGMCVLFTG